MQRTQGFYAVFFPLLKIGKIRVTCICFICVSKLFLCFFAEDLLQIFVFQSQL